MARQASLSAHTVEAAYRLLDGRNRGWRGYPTFAGPAVMASIAYMDPGNFATNIQAGARYGYELLWVVLLANLVAMLFQGLSARLGIVTGRNLAELSRDHLPLLLGMLITAVVTGAILALDRRGFRPLEVAIGCMVGVIAVCYLVELAI